MMTSSSQPDKPGWSCLAHQGVRCLQAPSSGRSLQEAARFCHVLCEDHVQLHGPQAVPLMAFRNAETVQLTLTCDLCPAANATQP